MRRLGALLAAVAMVAGAVALRSLLVEDGGGSGDGGSTAGDGLVLACSSTLEAACRRLDGVEGIRVVVADDADVAAQLSAADGGQDDDAGLPAPDAWLTVAPWAALAADDAELAGAAPPLARPSAVLARSPVTLVLPRDRAAAVAPACGGAVTWACLGGAAGEPWTELGGQAAWGTLKPGLPDPARADGLVVLSQATASRLGRTDFAGNDLEDDPAVGPWFDQLVGAAKETARETPGPPLARLLQSQAFVGAVGALEADSAPAVQRAAGGGELDVIYPEPVVTADVVLAPAAGRDAAEVLDRLGRGRVVGALASAGWRAGGSVPPGGGGAPALPDRSGVPGPGVLAALLERWEQVP